MVKIYHNPRCTKSRETLQILLDHGIQPKIIDYLNDVPTISELKSILKLLGISAFDLLRKNESLFKEEFKDKELTENEWVNVMIEFPKLIERPIVINGNKAVIGRPPESVLKII